MPMPILFAAGSLTAVNPGLIIWTLVTFVILLLVLSRVAWKPILRMVETREGRIHEALAAAERQREEAERMIEEHRSALASARKEAADMVRKAQAELDASREAQLAQARKEAEGLVESARRQITEEQKKAFAEVREVAVELAIQAAGRLIRTDMDEAKQRELVNAYLDDLSSSERAAS